MVDNLKIFADKSIEKPKEDLLLFNDHVTTLAEIISACETPYSISINGSWGTGKTSFMKLLMNSLSEKENTHCIWFDAWPYAHEEHIWKSMLVSILNKIDPRGELAVDKKQLFSSLMSLSSEIVPAVLTGGISLTIKRPDIEKLLDSYKKREEVIITDRVKTIQTLRKEFEQFVLKKVSKTGKLVIFIDDIDRVSPEKVLEMLEAISLFLGTKGTVFVIGCDLTYIDKCISSEYEKLSLSGYRFIEKMIQLPFSVPSISDQAFDILVKQMMPEVDVREDLDTYRSLVDCSINRNPRNIKRLFNLFKVVIQNKSPSEIYEDFILFKLLCMQLKWPELYNNCINSKHLDFADNFIIKLEHWARPLQIASFEEYIGFTEDEYYDYQFSAQDDMEQSYNIYRRNMELNQKDKEELDIAFIKVDIEKYTISNKELIKRFFNTPPFFEKKELRKYVSVIEKFIFNQDSSPPQKVLRDLMTIGEFKNLVNETCALFNSQNVDGSFFNKEKMIQLPNYQEKNSIFTLEGWNFIFLETQPESIYEGLEKFILRAEKSEESYFWIITPWPLPIKVSKKAKDQPKVLWSSKKEIEKLKAHLEGL